MSVAAQRDSTRPRRDSVANGQRIILSTSSSKPPHHHGAYLDNCYTIKRTNTIAPTLTNTRVALPVKHCKHTTWQPTTTNHRECYRYWVHTLRKGHSHSPSHSHSLSIAKYASFYHLFYRLLRYCYYPRTPHHPSTSSIIATDTSQVGVLNSTANN